MEHVRLGRTGLKVSRLCLGTMTFGFQCDEATAFAILDRAANAGITFMDSSDVYPLGGGLETALACRYRVGVDDERLSLGLPEEIGRAHV